MKIRYLLLFFSLLLFQKFQAQESIVVLPGSTVHLSASTTHADNYVWFHNGNIIPNEDTMYYNATEEGVYWVLATSEYGCSSDFSGDLQIIFEVPPPEALQEVKFCSDEKPTLDDINIIGENIQWYASLTSITPLENSTLLTEESLYYATQTINGQESEDRASIYVSFIDCTDLLSITKTINVKIAVVGAQVLFKVMVKNLSSESVHNILVSEHITSGFNYNLHNTSHGVYNVSSGEWSIPSLNPMEEAILTITVTILEHGNHLNTVSIISSEPTDYIDDNNEAEVTVELNCLKIYNTFSPNNDGRNDYFKIDCIEKYPNNLFTVYNRNGQIVYKKNRYDNSWKGISNRSWITGKKGEGLPGGTYFYSLDLKNGNILTGWLYIIR